MSKSLPVSPSILVSIHDDAVRAGKRQPLRPEERFQLEAVALEYQRRKSTSVLGVIRAEAA